MPKSQEALGQYPNPKIPFLVLFLFAVSYKKRGHQKDPGVNKKSPIRA
jgi:hypothetical protein